MKNYYYKPHIAKNKRNMAPMLKLLHRKIECNISKYVLKAYKSSKK